MKKYGAGILLLVMAGLFLWGCSIEKVRAGDGLKPEYTVMKEADFPDKVKELVEQNREKEFQMTYQDGGYLYLLSRDTVNRTPEATVSRLRTFPCGIMPSI